MTTEPTSPPSSTDRRYDLAFWALLAGATLGKLALLAWAGLELTFDEAYYWAWSKRMDVCFFSKGPGIASCLWLTTRLGGDTEMGIRLTAVICSVLTAVIAFYWARGLFGEGRAALVAMVLMGVTPLMTVGGVMSTIDAPFFLCWTAATAAAWRAVRTHEWWAWGAVGLAFAAGLQCKFTMFFLPVGLVMFSALADRSLFLRPGPWAALAMGLASLIPMVWWNAANGWITIRHTADKATTEADRFVNLLHLPESLGAQMAVISPVIFVGVCVSLWRTMRNATGFDAAREDALEQRKAAFLLSGAAPIFLFYSGLAFHRAIPANWPVVGYLTAFAAAGWFWTRPWDAVQRWSLPVGAALALAMTSVLALDALLYRTSLPTWIVRGRTVAAWDPVNKLRGWREFAERTEAVAARCEAVSGRPTFVLSDHYSYAAWFGFYGGGRRQAHVIPAEDGVPRNQFDLWRIAGRAPAVGDDAVLVYEVAKGYPKVERLAAYFQAVADLDTFPCTVGPDGTEIRRIGLLFCKGFKGF